MKANVVQIAQLREREKIMNNEIKNQMESEAEEVIAILERANSTFERLFGKQEEESK